MKKLLVLLVLLVSGLGFSQTQSDSLEKWYNENKLAVEKEFVRLIDSARSSVMIEKLFHYRSKNGFTQKELRKIKKTEKLNGSVVSVTRRNYKKYRLKIDRVNVIKDVSVEEIVYDSLLSLASEHHAKYLTEVGNDNVSHNEYPNNKVKSLVLEKPIDRVKYYTTNRSFSGECLLTKWSSVEFKYSDYFKTTGITVKSVSNLIFQTFMDSKNHKEILMMRKDISFIGCSLVIDVKENFLTFVTVMGNEKNKYVPEIVEVYKK